MLGGIRGYPSNILFSCGCPCIRASKMPRGHKRLKSAGTSEAVTRITIAFPNPKSRSPLEIWGQSRGYFQNTQVTYIDLQHLKASCCYYYMFQLRGLVGEFRRRNSCCLPCPKNPPYSSQRPRISRSWQPSSFLFFPSPGKSIKTAGVYSKKSSTSAFDMFFWSRFFQPWKIQVLTDKMTQEFPV